MSEKIEVTPREEKLASDVNARLESRARKLGERLGKAAFARAYGKESPWALLTAETRLAYADLCEAYPTVTGSMVSAHLKMIQVAGQNRYNAAAINDNFWIKSKSEPECPADKQPADPWTGTTEYQYAGALRRFLDSADFTGPESLPAEHETKAAWMKRVTVPKDKGADGGRNDPKAGDRAADVAAVIRGTDGEMVKPDSELAKASAFFAEKLALFTDDGQRAEALIAAANAVQDLWDMMQEVDGKLTSNG